MATTNRTQWQWRICLCLVVATAYVFASAQNPSQRPITIAVDATHAQQKILHSELEIPASPGPLTLYYPKWLPADHSPDGPITNLAGLKFSAQGKEIPWQQDDVDMYAFHLDVPKGADSIHVHLDFLLSVPGPIIDFSASGSSKLLILMWHEVLLYPAGLPANQITFNPTCSCLRDGSSTPPFPSRVSPATPSPSLQSRWISSSILRCSQANSRRLSRSRPEKRSRTSLTWWQTMPGHSTFRRH